MALSVAKLRFPRRLPQGLAGLQRPRNRPDAPRSADGGASDHHRPRPRRLQHRARVLQAPAIAVDGDGNGHGFDDVGDRAPVGFALIELAAGAAVHGDHRDARGLGAARQFGGVALALVPAEPGLQRHGDRYRARTASRIREAASRSRISAAPASAPATLPGRATHVDVDDFRARRLDAPGGLGHRGGFAADELDGVRAHALALGAQTTFAIRRRGRSRTPPSRRRSASRRGGWRSGACRCR